MSDAIAQERREAARRAVLEFLAARQAVAHHPETIKRRVNEGHRNDFTLDEVNGALVFLASLACVEAKFDTLGGTRYWQATSAGVLQHERAESTE